MVLNKRILKNGTIVYTIYEVNHMADIKTIIELKGDYGRVDFLLREVLEQRKLNRNQVAKRINVSHKLMTKWCDGQVERMDLDILSKLCYVLDCQISDILVYIKPEDIAE